MIESYDKSKIGRLISWGGDHTVFEYGHDKVIKYSLIELLMGKEGRPKIERDYRICKDFFRDYLLPTELKISKNGKFTIAIQPKIFGKYLRIEDLANAIVKHQFREIMLAYNKLISSGYDQIDFVGRGGVFKNCMSNIFVTPSKRLVIIDTTLLEFKSSGVFSFLFFFIKKLAVWRNNNVIKMFIKSVS